MKRQPSANEAPATKHTKQTHSTQVESTNDSDYDIPDGMQGLMMDSGSIPIATSHGLKLPAEYDEVCPPEYQNHKDSLEPEFDSGYQMLDECNMSPSITHYMGSVGNKYTNMSDPTIVYPSQPSNSQTQKAKTLTAVQMDYETPVDADVRSHTLPTIFNGDLQEDYGTPLDA